MAKKSATRYIIKPKEILFEELQNVAPTLVWTGYQGFYYDEIIAQVLYEFKLIQFPIIRSNRFKVRFTNPKTIVVAIFDCSYWYLIYCTSRKPYA